MTRFRLISLSSCHGQQRALPAGEAMSLFKLPGFHVSRLQVAGCRPRPPVDLDRRCGLDAPPHGAIPSIPEARQSHSRLIISQAR